MTKNTCIMCDKPAHRRGLCTTHYSRFRTKYVAIKEAGGDAQEFDRVAVAAGMIAEDRKGQKPTENEFDDIAEKFLSPDQWTDAKEINPAMNPRKKKKPRDK